MDGCPEQTTEQPPFDPQAHHCLLWIMMANVSRRFILATTQEAFDHARSVWCSTLVVSWEQWNALGAGLEEVRGAERQVRLFEALNYFADQQGVPRLVGDGYISPA